MSNANFSLYVKRTNKGIVLAIYVDDLIVTSDSDANLDDVKLLLKQKFEMKDLEELHYFLGIELIRSFGGIWLLWRQYGLDMLSRYGMIGCKPIFLPLEQNVKLNAEKEELLEDVTLCRHKGSQIWMRLGAYIKICEVQFAIWTYL